jgi:hypothetical protein
MAPYVLTVESVMIVFTAAMTIGPYLVCEMKR